LFAAKEPVLLVYLNAKVDTLRRYLPFEHGSPSDDTLRRFFRALDSEAFESCFIKWLESFQSLRTREGKT